MVVGKRSTAVGIMYGIVELVILIVFPLLAMELPSKEKGMVYVATLILLVTDGITLYFYLKTPPDAIILNFNKSISLPGYDVTLAMSEVTDISYRRASAKGIQYKWGKVIIKTQSKKYVVNYLSECENVAKQLTEEMFQYRNQNM